MITALTRHLGRGKEEEERHCKVRLERQKQAEINIKSEQRD